VAFEAGKRGRGFGMHVDFGGFGFRQPFGFASLEEGLEFVVVFGRKDGVDGTESVSQMVAAGGGFSLFGAGAGAQLAIFAIGLNLF